MKKKYKIVRYVCLAIRDSKREKLRYLHSGKKKGKQGPQKSSEGIGMVLDPSGVAARSFPSFFLCLFSQATSPLLNK